MSVKSVAAVLARIPLFEGSEPAHLQMLAFTSKAAKFDKGATVIEAGQPSAAACLILSGETEVRSMGRAIARAGAGSLLGEMSMIAGSAYSISAIALEPVQAALIGRETFLRVAEEFPEFGLRAYRLVATRLGESSGDLAKLRDRFAGSAA